MAHAQARALSAGVVAAPMRTASEAPRRGAAVASPPSSCQSRKLKSPTRRSSPVSASASASASAASADSSSSSSSSASSSAAAAASTSSRRSRAGRATYAPATFDELVDDASAALLAALDDGLRRVEVEFPALPGDKDGASAVVGSRDARGGGESAILWSWKKARGIGLFAARVIDCPPAWPSLLARSRSANETNPPTDGAFNLPTPPPPRKTPSLAPPLPTHPPIHPQATLAPLTSTSTTTSASRSPQRASSPSAAAPRVPRRGRCGC